MWERQALRAELAAEWWVMVGGRPGLRVLDAGCGPGFFTVQYAAWGGQVVGIDVDEDALAHLRAQAPRTVATARVDLEREDPPTGFDVAFVTDVLHHADPAAVLRRLARSAPLLLVAEFDPDGEGEIGPPREARISRARMLALLRDAGWMPDAPESQGHDHYAIVARRA
jgi:SAM-dependent methyltransferase